MRKNYFIFVIILIVIFITGVFWYFNDSFHYQTAKVTRGKIVETIYGVGTLQSHHIFRLKLAIVSTIEEFFVKEGSYVKKGQNLIRLTDGPIIKAPFEGTITSLPFKLGETIFPQAELLTLIDLTDLYVSVSIEQEGALKVRPGQKVKFSFSSLPDQVCEGEVTSIVPQGVGFTAYINAEKFPEGAIHGMTADVSIELNLPREATLVPYRAIIGNKLLIKSKINRNKIEVKTGISDGKFTEIISPEIPTNTEVIIPK